MASHDEMAALAAEIDATHARIRDTVQKTPCLASRDAQFAGARLLLKCENFQTTGSFKLRGALSKLSSLPVSTPVITASSGNHGIACSYAAQTTGHRLSVVLPETVAQSKLAEIKRLGATPILFDGDSGLAERHARQLAEADGFAYVSPYNDPTVMAGQGTIALELLEQAPDMDRVYVSMGGGGLISGIGTVLKTRAPHVEIVGVSAAHSQALAASLEARRVVDIEHLPTLADGVAGGMDHDSVTFPIAQTVIDRVITCDEAQIEDALRHLAWTENMIVEGAAALAMAGFLSERAASAYQQNVVLLCGGNYDRKTLQPILMAGAMADAKAREEGR